MPTRKQAKDNEERAASFVQADTEQQANDERPATPASVDQATTATTQPASTVPVISNPGKPPKFFEGGSLSAFIKQFSEWCLLAGISSDQERIFRLKQQVDSKTYAILDAVLETNPSFSFHDATQQLLNDLGLIQPPSEARHSFLQLKQGTNSVSAFVALLRNKATEAFRGDPQVFIQRNMLDQFINGLDDERVRVQVALASPASFERAVEIARTAERVLPPRAVAIVQPAPPSTVSAQGSSNVDFSSQSLQQALRDIVSVEVRKIQSTIRTQSTRGMQRAGRPSSRFDSNAAPRHRDDLTCFQCGGHGHFRRQCTSTDSSDTRTCFQCEGTGHVRNNCPNVNRPGSQQ